MPLVLQNFCMKTSVREAPADYIKQCGQRLEIARNALGYANRSAFVRLIAAEDADDGDLRRRLSQLEKWEKGSALVRPWFVDRLKRLFGLSHDYIYSGDKSGLRPDLSIKIEDLEHKNSQT